MIETRENGEKIDNYWLVFKVILFSFVLFLSTNLVCCRWFIFISISYVYLNTDSII
jgi:hypothetical protein